MDHVTPVTPLARSRGALGLPLALGASLVAIALVAVVAGNATADPQARSAPNAVVAVAASDDPSGATSPRPSAAGRSDNVRPVGVGRGGHGPGRGPGYGPISITAINGSQLSLATDNGWTRTIDASNATIQRGETEIALADLRVGDQIAFREVRTSDGTTAITLIRVLDPQVVGTIAEVTASAVTVRLPDGSLRTLQTTPSTTYRLGREAATREALVVGNVVRAVGTASGDTFTATEVRIAPATIAGQVTARTRSTITVTDATGATRTINVSASTTYGVRGDSTPSLEDIATGDRIVAQGRLNSDGSLDATLVVEGRDRAGGGPGGRGGFGGKRGGNGGPTASPTPSSGTGGSSNSG